MNQYLMVWRGKLEKTSGGLKKRDLMKNKRGKIVSKRRHNLAKRRKTLMKLGYKTEKGVFKKFTKKTKGGRSKVRSAPMEFRYGASKKVDRSAPQLNIHRKSSTVNKTDFKNKKNLLRSLKKTKTKIK